MQCEDSYRTPTEYDNHHADADVSVNKPHPIDRLRIY